MKTVQEQIKQYRELMDTHGDVAIPISRIIPVLEGLEKSQSTTAIDREKLVKAIVENLDTSFSSREIADFSISLDGKEIDLDSVEIEIDSLEVGVRYGVNNYFKP